MKCERKCDTRGLHAVFSIIKDLNLEH